MARPASHKAALDIFDGNTSNEKILWDTRTALLNVLEDSAAERTESENAFRATLNILSDLSDEANYSHEVQRALLNLLDDSASERARLEEAQRGILNILEDFDTQREAAEAARDQVEQANRDLESFSYSVAHDLRAPLRAIDGFSRILMEEHADDLDGEGLRLLNVVVTNAVAMGKLIDGLLAFSRLGRSSLSTMDIDMTELVSAVDEELRSLEPARAVEVQIGPLGLARCDPAMVRQVWTNLLSNSLKFTREQAHAHILVRRQDVGREIIYSVSDDGVGFDMQYADKLFGVFQRLHTATEYEGTGIGLAISRRIVERHGGRVWATSSNGATTFNFTLPGRGRNGA
jgi:light-regulated signal transduction histidine kinase (bacteriophytochrome)